MVTIGLRFSGEDILHASRNGRYSVDIILYDEPDYYQFVEFDLGEYEADEFKEFFEFEILGMQLAPDGLRIEFSSIPEKSYRLFASQDLFQWNPVGEALIADQSVSRITDAELSSKMRFYKVEALAGK